MVDRFGWAFTTIEDSNASVLLEAKQCEDHVFCSLVQILSNAYGSWILQYLFCMYLCTFNFAITVFVFIKAVLVFSSNPSHSFSYSPSLSLWGRKEGLMSASITWLVAGPALTLTTSF